MSTVEMQRNAQGRERKAGALTNRTNVNDRTAAALGHQGQKLIAHFKQPNEICGDSTQFDRQQRGRRGNGNGRGPVGKGSCMPSGH